MTLIDDKFWTVRISSKTSWFDCKILTGL